MKTIRGTHNRVIEIDLGTRTYEDIPVSREDRKKYMGGKGLALKLLYDRLVPGIDPLGKENYFIMTTGVLNGTGAPNSARFSAVSKSPLTGIITHSSCGGPFGNALKTSGWDGLILKGVSAEPVVLAIDSAGVRFLDAHDIWGKTTRDSCLFLEEFGKGSLVIGPAGENGVRYANIRSGERFLGRGGLGAVMGSKKVKGLVAKGDEIKIIPENPGKFKRVSSRGFRFIKKNTFTGKIYKEEGTLLHMIENSRSGILPVRNFRGTSDVRAEQISGMYVKENRITGFNSCGNCSILCGHKGKFNGKITSVPEYETTAFLGSNLEIFDIDKISEWNDLCGELGIDTISAGGTIAFVMEAAEKGLIDSPLRFGNTEHISQTLSDIAYQRGFGRELARGSRYLSEKYGGKGFCMQVKGLELGGYHPIKSFGMGLNYAVANRGGCHLSSAVFGLENMLGYLRPETTRLKAVYVAFMENIFAGINSLHTCNFTIFPYILESKRLRYFPVPVIRFMLIVYPALAKRFWDLTIYSGLFSAVTGLKLSPGKFLEAGERIHILERYMNTREGIRAEDDRLPERIMSGNPHPFPLKKMLKKYYKLRKFTFEGIPSRKHLEQMGIIPVDRD